MGKYRSGFTIVELAVVVIVIGILAAVAVLGYGTWRQDIAEQQIQSDLTNAASAMESARNFGKDYPLSLPTTFTASEGVTLTVTSSGLDFCIRGTSTSVAKTYSINKGKAVKEGACDDLSVYSMQRLTNATCPINRALAVDARDSHTYWVKKIGPSCWMMTNLAYAGGGDTTFEDVKTLQLGSGAFESSGTSSEPMYYIPPGANVTTFPDSPSTATNGIGQYGYLYNWCGAMGGQATSACSGTATTPTPVTTTSVCPAGWRLPLSAELSVINSVANGGSTTTSTGLRINWLAQYSGSGSPTFYDQGLWGHYWSASQSGTSTAYKMALSPTSVSSATSMPKYFANALRCMI